MKKPISPDAESRHFSGMFLNVGVKPRKGEVSHNGGDRNEE